MKYQQTTNNSTKNTKTSQNFKSTKTKTMKNVNILDFNSNPTRNNVINSPKSIYCMKKNGFVQTDILYVPFSDFCNNHPETIRMTKDEKRNRYDFYENFRQSKIEKIIKERDDLIQWEEEHKEQLEQEQYNTSNNQSMNLSQAQKYDYYFSNKTTKSRNQSQNQTQYHSRPRSLDHQHNRSSAQNDQQNDETIEILKAINQKKISRIVEYEIQKDELLSSKKIPKDIKDIKDMIKEREGSRGTTGENCQSIEMDKKYLNFIMTQYKIQTKIHDNNTKKKKEQEIKEVHNKKKNEINQLNQIKNQTKEISDKKEIMMKMSKKEMVSQDIYIKNIKNHKQKIEEQSTKRIMMTDTIKRNNRCEEQDRENEMKKIIIKQEKYEKNKEIAKNDKENRMKRIQEIKDRQVRDIEHLNRILSNGVNESTMNEIETYFHDNNDIFNAIQAYYVKQEKKKQLEKEQKDMEQLNKEKENNNNVRKDEKTNEQIKNETQDCNKDKDNREIEDKNEDNKKNDHYSEEDNKKEDTPITKLTEEEIIFKTKDYCMELNKNFLKYISNERENDRIREERLRNETNYYKKQELEKQYGKERTMSNYHLSLKNDELSFKVKEYENNLRKQSGLQSKNID